MNPDSNSEKVWFDLFCRAADDRLTPEEARQLERILMEHEKARRRWFEFRDLECGLSVLPAPKVVSRGSAEDSDALPINIIGIVQPFWQGKMRWILGGMAVAVVLLGLVSPWMRAPVGGGASSRLTAPREMARLGAVSGAIWGLPDMNFREGDSIPARCPLELLSGSAEVRFRSGAVATLYAPCIFEVTSGNGGFLTYGKLKAKASTAASRGFTVQTPTARLVDIGTEFLAVSSEDGQSRVEVLSGEVRVHLPNEEASQSLNEGQTWSLPSENRKVIVKIEDGDGTEEFRLPSIERPSERNYLRFTDAAASGRVWAAAEMEENSGAKPVQLRREKLGSVLADLGNLVTVTKVNAYSWRRTDFESRNGRDSAQRFALYASASDAPPATNGPLEQSGWDFIGRVNSDKYFGVDSPENRPEQQAISFSAASGCLGRYRYLLWVPLESQSDALAQNSRFLGEFDVYTAR